MSILIETSLGDLVLDLDVDGSPELCRNVLGLATARFYTSTLISAIVPGRTARFGDPVGNGSGGTSVYGLLDKGDDYQKSSRRCLADAAGRTLTATERREKGRVVMVGMDGVPNTLTSQFLITIGEGLDQALDNVSLTTTTVRSLGVVVEDDSNVLDQLNGAYIDAEGRPYADIRIRRALVIHNPFDDTPIEGMDTYLDRILDRDDKGRVIRSPSPERPAEEAVRKRIGVEDVGLNGLLTNGDGDDDGSMDSAQEAAFQAQLKRDQEEAEKRADKSRAVVLEMLGDLPDADIKAPEDVLFICKLNPETMDEDLELIFSRFDEKVKVEIIRDADTGASLQYAFAEFTSKQAAEEAYLKMDNALVDDRRIKVDFSQSVSKLWDKYNQKMRMPAATGRDGSFMASRDRAPIRRQRAPGSNQQSSTNKHYDQRRHDDRHRRRDGTDHRVVGDRGIDHRRSLKHHHDMEESGRRHQSLEKNESSLRHHRSRGRDSDDDRRSRSSRGRRHHRSRYDDKSDDGGHYKRQKRRDDEDKHHNRRSRSPQHDEKRPSRPLYYDDSDSDDDQRRRKSTHSKQSRSDEDKKKRRHRSRNHDDGRGSSKRSKSREDNKERDRRGRNSENEEEDYHRHSKKQKKRSKVSKA